MTLYEMTKMYGEGKGESMMWKVVEAVSCAIEKSMPEEGKEELMRTLYEKMSGGHYNEDYAKSDVEKMYYVEDGKKHFAPYWTDEQVKSVYESVKPHIPSAYNFWDFYVALQMVKSDHCPLLKKWFPSATDEELTKKVVELTINWLADEDNPFGKEKVWGYLNSID